MPLATTWMELESIILSEINQSEKNKYHMISLIGGISETNERSKKRERERQTKKQTLNFRELMVTRGEVGGGDV